MLKKNKRWRPAIKNGRIVAPFCGDSKGQALVEFTLIFILMLVVAWIPADFGLAFYTGQLAQNASRESARIAAADTTLNTQTGGGTVTCTLPCGGALPGSILAEASRRLSSALLPGGTVSVTYPVAGGTTCNEQLRVQVTGTYNFFFYQLLALFGAPVSPAMTIDRQTDMRWEHQSC